MSTPEGNQVHEEHQRHVSKKILMTPYPDIQSAISFGDDRRITFAENWDQVLGLLQEYGAGTKAAVLTDATIMAFSE